MDILSIVKKQVQTVENQLTVDLKDSCLKPLMFIDNTAFDGEKDAFGIMHMELLNSKEVVSLKSRQMPTNMFSVVNLIGEDTVYVVWGAENIDVLRATLSKWDYPVGDDTKFIDLKTEASGFLGVEINSFDDAVANISFSTGMESAFSSRETVMYSLFVELLNRGYENNLISTSIEDGFISYDRAYEATSHKGRDFRKERTSITFENKDEVTCLEQFIEAMQKYSGDVLDYMDNVLRTRELSTGHRKLLTEKAAILRFKRDAYKFAKTSISMYKSDSELVGYNFYLKAVELYCFMEDAYMLRGVSDGVNAEFDNFMDMMGEAFASPSSSVAHSFIMRKNVLSKLSGK